jgi:hypothetical protein
VVAEILQIWGEQLSGVLYVRQWGNKVVAIPAVDMTIVITSANYNTNGMRYAHEADH